MKENDTKTQNKGLRVLKAILNTIINVMIVLVLIASLLIAVMALTSKSSGVSTVFGYTIQTIESDSMLGGSPDGYEGGNFGHGDLMIAKATAKDPDARYAMGDIVTFSSADSTGAEMLIVHRIVDVVAEDDGSLRYQTWGDNREMAEQPDQTELSDYLSADDILSVFYSDTYKGKIISGVGNALDYLKTQQGFFLVVLLPMIIFFMYELVRVVLNATEYKKTRRSKRLLQQRLPSRKMRAARRTRLRDLPACLQRSWSSSGSSVNSKRCSRRSRTPTRRRKPMIT